MRWRSIRICIIVVLVLLNVGVSLYLWQEKQQNTVVSETRIETVRQLYQEVNIGWAVEPDPAYPERGFLLLDVPDLEKYVQNVIGTAYEETYLYGSRVKYTTSDIEVIIDREKCTLNYSNSSEPEKGEREKPYSIAKAAAEVFLDNIFSLETELKLDGGERKGDNWVFTYHQVWEGEHLPFNEIQIAMEGSVVRSVDMTCFQPRGWSEETFSAYPIDELLYRCYQEVERYGGKTIQNMTDIMYGYQLDESGRGIPSVTFVFNDDSRYTYERIAIE